jgi:hypothetical protein
MIGVPVPQGSRGRGSLDLVFDGLRPVDPRVTFTRSTVATRVNASGLIETAPINSPRIDYDPVTLACKGLLIEEARTNLLIYSQEIDNAVWGKGAGITVTANTVTAPDGTTTADTLTSAGGQYIDAFFTVTNGVAYTFSFFAKAGSLSSVTMLLYGTDFNSGGANLTFTFDLSAGTTGSANATITSFGNGWYRCTGTATLTAATGAKVAQFARLNTAGTIYLWGAQLEAGAFATSYIPTVASQETRAADVAVMTGANFSDWYRQDEGTFVATITQPTAANYAFTYRHIIFACDVVGSSAINLLVNYANQFSSDSTVSAASLAPLSSGTNTGAEASVAYGYKANDFALSAKGAASSTDTSGAVSSVLINLHIGSTSNGAVDGKLNGHIKRLTYYPSRLPNATLQALTS